MNDKTLEKARGMNSIANPAEFRGSGRKRVEQSPLVEEGQPSADSATDLRDMQPAASQALSETDPPEQVTVVDMVKRKRRELTISEKLYERIEASGLNPTDVVMAAYRGFADQIYQGGLARMLDKNRTRLRINISDREYDQLTRLGNHRGWNRSEVVSVLLQAYLNDGNPS